jgi:hypothetical protein
MTKADLKNNQRVWVNDGIILVMLGRVNILPSGYTTLTDPKGFVYALSFLESKFSELNFEIYEPF